ncbi:MAG TPA: YdeI/OmpD-associated family protein [Cyclobacteriaceae bacterium]|nr:YdeI/OmpD-associated family protein [Cyclobacteriaceae bacterium]
MAKVKFSTTIVQDGNKAGIVVPDDAVEKLGAGKRPPVNITINKFTYRNTVAVMGGKYMIGVSQAIREQANVKGGDKVEVTLELDTKPREVVLHPDFRKALATSKTAQKFFDTLSYSSKLRFTIPIDAAKTDETRNRNIAKAIDNLKKGVKL